jgi:hypothetical protein
MILDTAIAEVQQICGWRSDKVNEITRGLSYAQIEREKPNRTYPWFLRKENPTAIVTVANQPMYSIPTDYIEDTEEVDGNLYYYTLGIPNSRTIFLKKLSFQPAQIRYYGEWPYVYTNPPDALLDTGSYIAPGVPSNYYLGNSIVMLYPVPDAVYSISWRYWAQDAPQALGQENKWLKNAPWVLIGHAALKLCMDLGYKDGQATAQALMQSAEENLFRAIINRSEAGRKRNMGSRL